MGFFRYCLFMVCCFLPFSSSALALGREAIASPPSSYPSDCPQDRYREAIREKNFHVAIALVDTWVSACKNPASRAFLLVEKAKLLAADQQQAAAQEVFLEALQTLPSMETSVVSDAEKNAFDALFPSYENACQSAQACSCLLEEAERQLHDNPAFASLEHYSAACLANRGQFIEFFDRFFHAFQQRPDCFLRYKTIGVLHLRLFEASSSEERRETHRREAVRYLKEAFSRQMNDSTVLVKLAYILPPKEKILLLRDVTADLMGLTTPIRRSDCFFLIQQAIDVGHVEIAKQLIDKARSWYQYSRALNDLSDQIKELEATAR